MAHADIVPLDAPFFQELLAPGAVKLLPGPMDPAGTQAQAVSRQHEIAQNQAAVLQQMGSDRCMELR